MDLATGAMASLLPKLVELLHEEYKLQTGVKKDVEFLEREMKSMDAALRKVVRVPRDQLDEQVKIWADQVRELSYEIEDLVDSFLVRVEGSTPIGDPDSFKGLRKKMANLFKKGKTRHEIADAIKDIKDQVQEVAARRDRYKVDDAGANLAASTTIDPRMLALFKDQRELVGIDKPRDELIKRLTGWDGGFITNFTQQLKTIFGFGGVSEQRLKMLSIFGFGGLGKTTLAKAVYDKLQGQFARKAFVSVGRNPNLKKVLMDILRQIDKPSYVSATMLDEEQLVGELQDLLQNKRYLIVIDDMWDRKSWEIIRCAWVDSNCGSIIIITTRIREVAEVASQVYEHKPLLDDKSRELFYRRLSITEGKNSYDRPAELSEKILQKCGGVPLAIITIASLLAGKPWENWPKVYNSIGFGHEDNTYVDNTRKILLYSYYDLPCHLRTCLLHLSIYPEDYEVEKDTLIWKWIGEGFIHEIPAGVGLFEMGERYFNELINKSMIQPIGSLFVRGCRVHDLVLDMIYSLSKEENFVTVLGSDEQHCPPLEKKVRRLAIQKGIIKQGTNPMINTPMTQVRSLNAVMCRVSIMPPLLGFQALRVLAIEESVLVEDGPYHLEHLDRLVHLRYLGLSGMPIAKLPEEIGNLRFLQTLDLSDTKIKELPRSIGLLRQLKCLRFDGLLTGVSDCIGKLTSLEDLSLRDISQDLVKELGKLRELRRFRIGSRFDNEKSLFDDLMVSLSNLDKLLDVRLIFLVFGTMDSNSKYKGNMASKHLHSLHISYFTFPRLPAWINSSHIPNLSYLRMGVKVMEAQDWEILGRLPELIFLRLSVGGDVADFVGGGTFPKLRFLSVDALFGFMQGAMPSLESLQLAVNSSHDMTPEIAASIMNLPCLRNIEMFYMSNRRQEEMRKVLDIHPNRHNLHLTFPDHNI